MAGTRASQTMDVGNHVPRCPIENVRDPSSKLAPGHRLDGY